MLRIQQGIWHAKGRTIIVFEGFDAAGKGGAIRTLTSDLDPRSIRVHSIGPPGGKEQGKHYLYRFWDKLPAPGAIAVFDRSWYGRVLVERVEKLAPKKRIKEAYDEINQFEKKLVADGIELMKFFLAITPDEQLRRFEERLENPYKQWKLTEDDVRAREKWDDYVDAAEKMLERTNTSLIPWHFISADHKAKARHEVLDIVTRKLESHRLWIENKAAKHEAKTLKEELKKLKTLA